jgi:hypothetical protein
VGRDVACPDRLVCSYLHICAAHMKMDGCPKDQNSNSKTKIQNQNSYGVGELPG